MTKKQKMAEIIRILKENVRNDCALEYEGDAWRLAVMARLSAQCTDARVNTVSRELFKRYPTAKDMAIADITELEDTVRPCGLFRTKASSIKEMSAIIVDKYDGNVPSEMDDLLALPGVGRKIANLIRGDLYNLGGIVADTHCIRICGRLGFYPESEKDAHKVEKTLAPLVPTEEQTDLCHRLVWFGRETCSARSPKCNLCPLNHLCKHFKNK
jgi:endonuclease-3